MMDATQPQNAPRAQSDALLSDAAANARVSAGLATVVLAAGQAETAAEASVENSVEMATPRSTTPPQWTVRMMRPQRSRRTFVLPAAQPPPPAPAVTPTDTQSELRNWVKDNATLLSNASLLISISALALNLLPETGILDPYIKALVFGAAIILLAEMHSQWPEDLQLHMLRPTVLREQHSWRMVAFAFIMQVATVVFAVWATLTTPLILIPLTALVVVVAFRQWYFRRFRGVVARGFGIIALIAALLLSELLMVLVWLVITGDQLTVDFWTNDRPGITIQHTADP